MVYIRRQYFAKRFAHLVVPLSSATASTKSERGSEQWHHKMARLFTRGKTLSVIREQSASDESTHDEKGSRKVNRGMIRRMDDAPQLIDPSGGISHNVSPPVGHESPKAPEDQLIAEPRDIVHRFGSNTGVEPSSGPSQRGFPRTMTVEFGPLESPRRPINGDSSPGHRPGFESHGSELRGEN